MLFRSQPLDLRLGKAEFLRWVEGQPGRYELVEGRVVMMTGGSKNHARVMSAIAIALGKRLDLSRWAVTVADLAIDVGESIRYPDVLVEALDDRGQERSTREPIFACEVLSPSSLDTDFDDKPTEYGAMATLQYYLVAEIGRAHV